MQATKQGDQELEGFFQASLLVFSVQFSGKNPKKRKTGKSRYQLFPEN